MNGLTTATVSAERGLVLSLLDCAISNQMHWIADVRAWFNPETHMTQGPLAKIAGAVFTLAAAKGPVTPEGIAIVLKSDDPPELTEVSALIHDSSSQAAHLRFFALEVVKCWRARQTSMAAKSASYEISQGGDVDDEIERLSGLRARLMPPECTDGLASYSVIDTMLDESKGTREPDPGYRFSCKTLTQGLERTPLGSLVTVGAPTGVGKTILLCQEAQYAARQGDGISLLFSVEMSVRQIAERMAKSLGGCPAIRSPEYTRALERVRVMLQEGHHLRIYAGPRSMDSIEAIVSAQAERGRIKYIAADYVQIITPERLASANREQQVSQITKRLKNLATKYDCLVMTASQLNKLGKVRESEAIEHDSDVCLLLSELTQGHGASRLGVQVSKNRHGTRDKKLCLAWDKSIYRFRDLECDDE